jgi:hypothetical protein
MPSVSVDRPNRDRAAGAIAAYMRGEIDNFRLDDETLSLDTDDRSLRDVALWIWHYYDDIKRHKVHASPDVWEVFGRCVVFLRTDLEWPARKARAHDWRYAPFASDEEWQAHRHLLETAKLPAYDPVLHQKSSWGPILGAEITPFRFAVGAVLIGLVVYVFSRFPC